MVAPGAIADRRFSRSASSCEYQHAACSGAVETGGRRHCRATSGRDADRADAASSPDACELLAGVLRGSSPAAVAAAGRGPRRPATCRPEPPADREPAPPRSRRQRRPSRAASSVQLPANTARRRNSTRSGSAEAGRGSSRSAPAASAGAAAPSGCRPSAGGSDRPGAAAIASSGIARTRAAASSIASGMPSRCRQISATVAAFASVIRNEGDTAVARSSEQAHGRKSWRWRSRLRTLARCREPRARARGRPPRRQCAAARGSTPGAQPSRAPRSSRSARRRAGIEQVLAVVEHQQRGLVRKIGDERIGDRSTGVLLDAERRGDDLWHEARVRDRRELDEPGAVRVVVESLGGELQRQAGLADAARAEEGQEPRACPVPCAPRRARARGRRRTSPAAAGCWARLPASAAPGSPGAAPDAAPGTAAPGSRGRAAARGPGHAARRRRAAARAPDRRPACESRTWPPCAAPMMRAARFTVCRSNRCRAAAPHRRGCRSGP